VTFEIKAAVRLRASVDHESEVEKGIPNMKRSIIVCALILFVSIPLLAQSAVDTLYLKNGTIIPGQVLEVTMGLMRFKSESGNITIYDVEKEVLKVAKATTLPPVIPKDTVVTIPPRSRRVEEIKKPVPPKTSSSFGLRGGLFFSLQNWNKLEGDPDSRLGFGAMGMLAAGTNFNETFYVGIGPSVAGNWWKHDLKSVTSGIPFSFSSGESSMSINSVDFGVNLLFGIDDVFLAVGTGSSNVTTKSTFGGFSSTNEGSEKASHTRIMVGFGHTIGFGLSMVFYSGSMKNLGRLELSLGLAF
jgi:hypothetical protein